MRAHRKHANDRKSSNTKCEMHEMTKQKLHRCESIKILSTQKRNLYNRKRSHRSALFCSALLSNIFFYKHALLCEKHKNGKKRKITAFFETERERVSKKRIP